MSIGLRILNLRKESGYTQKQIAEKTGISIASLWFFEKDQNLPSVNSLIKLAELYHVSTDYILGLSHYRAREDTNDPLVKNIMRLTDRDYFCVESLIKEMAKSYDRAKKRV